MFSTYEELLTYIGNTYSMQEGSWK